MAGNPIAIKMIESTIDKTIRDIKDNPEKGVKGLVDLANRFANNPFQKGLVETLQTMLTSSNSSYYSILPSLINNVNQHTLKTFIINMAYNSWSYGGKKIKQYKKAYNHSIPWTIIFDFTKQTGRKLSNDTIMRTIEQGKKIGIYTYMFFIDNIDHYLDILRRNLDCAFILYVPPTILTTENVLRIKSYHNTFFSVLYQPMANTKEFKDATKLLYEHQCLFGSHSYYGNENTDQILSSRWIDEIITTKSPFGFLIESKNCSKANASLIHDYIDDSKTNQKYPAFLIDLYEDITKIDQQLSASPCLFKLSGNGDVNCNPLNTLEKLNINKMTLLEILSKNNS